MAHMPSPSKNQYLCQECGHPSLRWEGRCPVCGTWGSYVEVTPRRTSRLGAAGRSPGGAAGPMELSQHSIASKRHLPTGNGEIDRLLGGGVVGGSVLLMAGEPGIGKSTLLLQMAAHWAGLGLRVLYVSGEESGAQVHLRARRLDVASSGLLFLAETNAQQVMAHLEAAQPDALVVDSAQTLESETLPSPAGSTAQVRECAQLLLRWAKDGGSPLLMAGHVTKDGAIAGPRVLEHMVDVVLYLEGDTTSSYRLLHCTKNRFGATNDLALLEMRTEGLIEVADPSAAFISERQLQVPGSTVVPTLEGTRPLLAEVQALTNVTAFNPPRRTTNGIEFARMLMITAVLSRRAGLALANQDIMVNVAGGLRIGEPAADLAVALTIASSFWDAALDPHTVVMGEVGLNGEVRGIPQMDRRLTEAARHGFTRALVPRSNGTYSAGTAPLKLTPVATLRQALDCAMPGRGSHRRGAGPFPMPD